MASAFSILRNYGDYIQPYDLNLIQQGLEYKQQKYDANFASIQQQVDQFTNLDIIKSEDRAYMEERLESLVNQVNEYGSMDLSSNGLTRNIQNHVKQTLDNNVINAITGTQAVRKYQQEIEYYKKEKPDQYSPINEMYGLRPVQEWLNDGQAGSKFRGSSYTPYTDVQGKLNKAVSDLVKNKSETEIQIPTQDGYIVTKKIKELNAEEIRSVATGFLNTQDRQQLEINGWYNFGQVPVETTRNILEQYKQERFNYFDGNIKYLEAKISSGVDGFVKQEYEDQISFLKSERNKTEDRINNISPDSSSIGAFLEQENMVGGLVSAYSFKDISIEYGKDQNYWSIVDHNYKIAKDNRDYQLELEKFNYQQQKDTLDREAKNKNQSQSDSSLDSNNDGITDYRTVSKVTGDDAPDLDTIENQYLDEIQTNLNQMGVIADEFYNNTTPQNQATIESIFTIHRLLPQNKYKEDSELRAEIILDISNNGQNTSFVGVDVVSKLNNLKTNVNTNKAVLREASDATLINVKNKAEDLYNIAMSNKNISTFFTKDGKVYKQSIQDYFNTKNINSFNDLNSNKDELNKFVSQAIVDTMLSEAGFGKNTSINGLERGKITMDNSYLLRFRQTVSPYLKQLGDIYGENLDFEDVFDVSSSNRYNNSNLKVIGLKNKEKYNKSEALIQNVFRSKSFDYGNNFLDDSFQDDKDSREILSINSKANKETYLGKLEESYSNLPQNKAISLQPGSVGYKESLAYISNQFIVDEKKPVYISQHPNSPGEIIISQLQTAGKSSKTGITNQDQIAVISKKDLQNTNLVRLLNLENQGIGLPISKFKPIEKRNISFADDSNINYVQGAITNVFGNNSSYVSMITKDGARNNLYTDYSAFILDENGGKTDVGQLIDSFTTNSRTNEWNNEARRLFGTNYNQLNSAQKSEIMRNKPVPKFSTRIYPNDTKTDLLVDINYTQGGDIKPLHTFSLGTTNYQDYESMYNIAPQLLIYTGFKDIMNQAVQEAMINGGFISSQKFNLLKDLYNIE